MNNYSDVLAQMRGAGLLVDSINTSRLGRIQRCRVEGGGSEKRGWYLLYALRLDSGDDVLVGSFGQWRGNENLAQKIELGKQQQLTAEQLQALKARQLEDRRRADAEQAARAEAAARRAAAMWRKLPQNPPDGVEAEYLTRKAVMGYGVRYNPLGAVMVPLQDADGKIHGLQIIRGRGKKHNPKDRHEKEFWPAGLQKKGFFHIIGSPAAGRIILVGEGYATMASAYAALGICSVVAFDAGNILPVVQALHKKYRTARFLIVADDDATQKCTHCRGRVWLPDGPQCPHCAKLHDGKNAGITAASAAALAVGGEWITPVFENPAQIRAAWLEKGVKNNDFNDLQHADGLQAVRVQIEARLLALGWTAPPPGARTRTSQASGAGDGALRPITDENELLERFSIIYGLGGKAVFDHDEHVIVDLADVHHLCGTRDLYKRFMENPHRKIVRGNSEIGFDPTESDPSIKCNLWSGWPTKPDAAKSCDYLLETLQHLCDNDDVFDWVIKWLAYPLQKPGAKMKTSLIIHGPQGAGKNIFFESYMSIFGRYGGVIDQNAIEDKFNEWASHKLFLIADEVIARKELWQTKGSLKSLITGDWIRINPKGLRSYSERNHLNLVFFSNEIHPLVIDDDDRRHCVIWTPPKKEDGFYQKVLAEVRAGGAHGLYNYLLNIDVGDFNEGTRPPMTQAKRDLMELSTDSSSKFIQQFRAGEIEGFPAENAPQLLLPAKVEDFYELYCAWCSKTKEHIVKMRNFVLELEKRHGARRERKRHMDGPKTLGPHSIIYLPGGAEMPPGENEASWIGYRIGLFTGALREYKTPKLLSA